MANQGDQQSTSAGGPVEWPRPVHDRTWIDQSGVQWRMRGQALDPKSARRLLRRVDLTVFHSYGGGVVEVVDAQREQLITRVLAFLHGDAPPHRDFELGDFRDDEHRVMLMVQEHC